MTFGTPPTSRTRLLLPLLVFAIIGSTGCAHVPKRNPLPEASADLATVLGIPRARYWGDEPEPWLDKWLVMSKSELRGRYPAVYGRPMQFLAISGGGADGAFAAGLLLGWTASGTRPDFTIVTGISAGALIAPFAFLGPDYDEVLRKVSVELKGKDVFKKRRLWRIGAIANSGHPRALALIRQIMLASASIPGYFPPVLIDVEVDGQSFDEIHVDGGTTQQVFLYPVGESFDEILDKLEIPGRPEVYVIRNGRIDPIYETVTPKTIPIAGRSVSSIIRTQGIGDLYRIYLETFRDGLDFNLAYIPKDFTPISDGDFDTEYMQQLYQFAFDRAKAGYPWQKLPPELKSAPIPAR